MRRSGIGKPDDNRCLSRRRTRLRSGKVVGIDGNFLIECQIHDVTEEGARIRLVADFEIPDRFFILDDIEKCLALASVIWRNGSDVGVMLSGYDAGHTISAAHIERLTRKFYAL